MSSRPRTRARTKSRAAGTRTGRRKARPVAARKYAERGTAHVTSAGGNVFRDLAFPPAEAENLKVRSDLMSALQDLMTERGLTQVEAAKLFGVSQPRISDLRRDKIDRFTVDALINMLARAGVRVVLTSQLIRARRESAR